MNTFILFESPRCLLLALLLIPVAAIQIYRLSQCAPAMNRLVSGNNVPGKKKGNRLQTNTKYITPLCLFSGAWLCAVLALANPFAGTELQPTKKQGCAVSFVFDISRSMLVSDMGNSTHDITRLSYAADFARKIMDATNGCAWSAVLAKGDAHLAIPLTRDRLIFDSLLETLNPALSSNPGTNLAAGLECAARSFPSDSSEVCFIIVLTDGESLSGNIADAATALRTSGIRVVFVGIGTAAGGIVPDVVDDSGNRIVSHLDKKTLCTAADSCGGLYVDSTEPSAGLSVVSQLRDSAAVAHVIYREVPRSLRSYALVLSLLLFCAAVYATSFVHHITHPKESNDTNQQGVRS